MDIRRSGARFKKNAQRTNDSSSKAVGAGQGGIEKKKMPTASGLSAAEELSYANRRVAKPMDGGDERRGGFKASSGAVGETERAEGGEEQYFLKWQSVDFVRTVEADYLYRAAIILAVIVILWSLWQGNYFSALPFALMIAVVIFELNSQPRAVNYAVNMDGVLMDGKLLPFSKIQSFDIITKGDLEVVRLKMRNAIFPLKEIFLAEGMDLLYVKALFEHFLPEERQEERLFNFETRQEVSEEDELDRAIDKYIQKKF